MRLRNRTSYMTGLPEGAPKRTPGSRVTSWLYLLFISSLVLYIGYLGVMWIWQFSGRGYVDSPRIMIRASVGGRIAELGVQSGQHVAAGTRLAVIEPTRGCSDVASPVMDSRGEQLHFEAQRKQIELDALLGELKLVAPQPVDEGVRRALEVDGEYLRRYEQNQKQAEILKLKIARVRGELGLLHRQSGGRTLPQRNRDGVIAAGACQPEVLVAPLAGRVRAVLRNRYEVVGRGDAVVDVVSDHAPVFIDVYFDQDRLDLVTAGKVLKVYFSDGTESEGRVESVRSAASRLPENSGMGYGEPAGKIIARITPVNQADTAVWARYDRMAVRVRGTR
ncbi:MAG: HlyD family efflux transporter periplasmic adaptor subunit [Gammaproteobacteria bacterium]|nr:HlyD family efflux transporter periplasmic adaptor subunit [Gammaproteobacteria bacterium]